MKNLPDLYLIQTLNDIDWLWSINAGHRLEQYYTNFQDELEDRVPDTQLYFGEPDDKPVLLPAIIYDDNGNEIDEEL